MIVNIGERQTIWDVCIQYYGDVQGLADLIMKNYQAIQGNLEDTIYTIYGINGNYAGSIPDEYLPYDINEDFGVDVQDAAVAAALDYNISIDPKVIDTAVVSYFKLKSPVTY
jgi:hypothetical protein